MLSINLRHQFHLLGRKTLIIIVCLLPLSSFAQRGIDMNLQNYDNRLIQYGFSIGLHSSAFGVNYSDDFNNCDCPLDTVSAIMPPFNPGFSLGFIVNFRLNDFLDVRLLPRASFYTLNLEYTYRGERPAIYEFDNNTLEPTYVELPILIKYKSERRANTRMYFIGGITPAIDASGKRDDVDDAERIILSNYNLMLEGGIGIDIYFELFKFSPEIRFSHGIMNILSDSNTIPISDGIDRLYTNTFGIYLQFQ